MAALAVTAILRALRSKAPRSACFLAWVLGCAGGASETVSRSLHYVLEFEVPPAVDLVGKWNCSYGDPGCNRCVSDVPETFAALARTPSARYRYRSREDSRLPPFDRLLPRFTLTDHVQSLIRVPGIGDENWLIGTRSQPNQPDGRAGFFWVHMKALEGNGGEAFATQPRSSRASKSQGTEYFYPMPGTDHPGGSQLYGRILAIGAECSGYQFLNRKRGDCSGRTFVSFFDVSAPERSREIGRLELDRSRGELYQSRPGERKSGYATAVALTRLADGRYLLFVSGKDSRREGWFYLSPGETIEATTEWHYLGYWHYGRGVSDAWKRSYQNINFLTECHTGALYAVAMGRERSREVADLYQLVADQDGAYFMGTEAPFTFRPVASALLRPSPGDYCTARAGSSIHVTPSGNLVLYCSTHQSARGALKFEQFVARRQRSRELASSASGAPQLGAAEASDGPDL